MLLACYLRIFLELWLTQFSFPIAIIGWGFRILWSLSYVDCFRSYQKIPNYNHLKLDNTWICILKCLIGFGCMQTNWKWNFNVFSGTLQCNMQLRSSHQVRDYYTYYISCLPLGLLRGPMRFEGSAQSNILNEVQNVFLCLFTRTFRIKSNSCGVGI